MPRSENGFLRSSPPVHPAYRCRRVSSTADRRIPCPPARFFADGRRQLPLAEHAGIAENLPGLGLRRSRESTQDQQGQECSHGFAGTMGVEVSRLPGQECARLADLDPALVGIAGDGDDLLVVFLRPWRYRRPFRRPLPRPRRRRAGWAPSSASPRRRTALPWPCRSPAAIRRTIRAPAWARPASPDAFRSCPRRRRRRSWP